MNYAHCTQIDQQIGALFGLLREEGILDNTVMMFTSDHGDSMGIHGIRAKQEFYEASADVPLILMGTKGDARVQACASDDRLAWLADVMPTLLNLAGIEIPDTVTGKSILATALSHPCGELGEGALSKRMIRDGRNKMIYCAAGSSTRLFELSDDPDGPTDLSGNCSQARQVEQMQSCLVETLCGPGRDWVTDARLAGLPNRRYRHGPSRRLGMTRGHQWPVPPVNPCGLMSFFPETPGDT